MYSVFIKLFFCKTFIYLTYSFLHLFGECMADKNDEGFWEVLLGNLAGLDERILDGDIRPIKRGGLAVEGEGPVNNMTEEEQLIVAASCYAKLALQGMSSSMVIGEFEFDLYDRESVLIAISYLEAEVLNSMSRGDAGRPEIPLYARVAHAYRSAIGEEKPVVIPEPKPLNTSPAKY